MLTDKQLDTERELHQYSGSGFSFRGCHSSEFNLYVEKYPTQRVPSRKRTTVSVPGRSGDLHYEEDAFENVQFFYECYFHAEDPVSDALSRITAWLHQPGYNRLEDAYDRNHFRLASFVGPADIENRLNRYGRCTITFDCKPQRFLVSGEMTLEFTAPSFIVNPTGFNAKPLIVVYGTGPGTVTVGNKTVEIKALEDQIVLDSELMDAYRQVGDAAAENKNSCIYAPEFPELTPGENIVTWTGGITSVLVTPRWWTL